MSEKIQTKRQELLDEMVAEIKLLINQKMDTKFNEFVYSMNLLRTDQIAEVFGKEVDTLVKQYWKLQ